MPLTHSPVIWLAKIRCARVKVQLTRHMAVATARVAGLASATTEATTIVVTVGGLGAVAGNVADLTTLKLC